MASCRKTGIGCNNCHGQYVGGFKTAVEESTRSNSPKGHVLFALVFRNSADYAGLDVEKDVDDVPPRERAGSLTKEFGFDRP